MISKQQQRNAKRIVELADRFGSLYYNEHSQTPERTLNLSVPCARLVVAGVVTGVDPETNDGLTDEAVTELEELCRRAVDFAVEHSTRDGAGVPTSPGIRDLLGPAASLLGRPSELEARTLADRPLAPGGSPDQAVAELDDDERYYLNYPDQAVAELDDDERYYLNYRDARNRWHRRRGSFELASDALAAGRALAASRGDVHGFRVVDSAGNTVAA